VLTALAVLALAGDALARGRGGDGRPGGAGRGLRGIDPTCASECGGRECIRSAQQDFRACVASTCPTEAAAAEDACEADRHSDACRSAREALHGCGAPCRETLQSARQACREETSSCLASCPRIDAEGKDRACVRECVGEARECLSPAHETLAECRAGCADLKDAAHDACAADRTSDACTSARDALESCHDACKAPFLDAASECFSGTQACVAACPAAAE
jgi:hypothetical protein